MLYYVFKDFPGPITPAALNTSSERYLRYDPQRDAIVEWHDQLQREQVLIRFSGTEISHQSIYTAQAGTFKDVIVNESDSQLRDAGTTVVFALHVGLIKYSFITLAGGGSFELIDHSIPKSSQTK